MIASAAFDNVIETLPAFRFGGKTYGYQRATAAPDPPLSGSNTLVVASPLNGCTPITNASPGRSC